MNKTIVFFTGKQSVNAKIWNAIVIPVRRVEYDECAALLHGLKYCKTWHFIQGQSKNQTMSHQAEPSTADRQPRTICIIPYRGITSLLYCQLDLITEPLQILHPQTNPYAYLSPTSHS